MAKKKSSPTVVNNIESVNMEIDYDKLAEAIVKAKEIEKEKESQQNAYDVAEWRKSIGVKDYEDKKGIEKKVFLFFNNLKVFLCLLFFPKKKEIKVSMTGIFMQSITTVFFNVIKLMLWVLSAMFICFVIFHGNMAFGFFDYFRYISLAVMAFLLAGIFRLMAIETEHITDRERVLGIFTAVMSVIPMVETIVSFFKEVR